MKVKIKLGEGAVMPKYAYTGDAGMDLTAVRMYYDGFGNIVYNTNISIEIPEGYFGAIIPRSSICKYLTFLTNSFGVIDSNYRGDILLKFKPTEMYHSRVYNEKTEDVYKVGDRIAQLIILSYPVIELEQVDFLGDSVRNTKGFGSSNESK